MKANFLLQAKYNEYANGEVSKLLAGLDSSKLNKDFGMYFKSPLALFQHILQADIWFMQGISAYAKVDLSKDLAEISAINGESDDIKYLVDSRKKVDNFTTKIIENISDFSKDGVLEKPNTKIQKPLYQLFDACFTHSIHHRGQISACLDMLKVDNDYSLMLGL